MVDIAHVVVLMLENRSFDHMLGYLRHPDPAFDGLRGSGEYTNPGWHGGPAVPASPAAKLALPAGPDHSHEAVMEQLAVTASGAPTNQGFVVSYERKVRGLDPPAFGGLLGPLMNWVSGRFMGAGQPMTGRGPLAMACQPPEHVPVLSRLALEFAVCTRWFCSVPGETWPNRNFAHAATSDGQTAIEIRPYTNQTIFELLEKHGADWRIYHDDTPQAWAFPALWDTADRHAKWFPFDQFTRHVAAGELTAYTFIEPNHRPPLHTLDHAPVIGAPDVSNSQHPENNLVGQAAYDGFTPDGESDFTRAERLVASVYEALRAHPAVFDRTVLLVTYDEHGGLYDHVPPPTGVPSPGGQLSRAGRLASSLLHRKAAAFDFTMLGPRVPAVVVSPHVAAGTVDSQIHDHYVSGLTAAVSAPPDAAAPVTAAESVPVPDHYKPFAALAEQVQQHMVAVGEPEAIASPPTGGPVQQSVQISRTFTAAAGRHRHSAGPIAPG